MLVSVRTSRGSVIATRRVAIANDDPLRQTLSALQADAARAEGKIVAENEVHPQGLRLRRMLKSKVHRIPITATYLDYEGSIALDLAVMEAARLVPFEAVDIANINTGDRFTTYVISGEVGECALNGAAARLGVVGDLLIIMAFDLIDDRAMEGFAPIVVHPAPPSASADASGSVEVRAHTEGVSG